jgi:hypothetical protein
MFKSNPKTIEVFSMILMKVLVYPKLLPLADHSGYLSCYATNFILEKIRSQKIYLKKKKKPLKPKTYPTLHRIIGDY